MHEKDELDQDLSGRVRLELLFEPMDRFLLPLIRGLRLNSALSRKSSTESTLDGPRVLPRKRDGGASEEREGARDGGICEGEVSGVVVQSHN